MFSIHQLNFSVVTNRQQSDISAADMDFIINIVNSAAPQIDLNPDITNQDNISQVILVVAHNAQKRQLKI